MQIGRRDFLKYCSASAATIGLSAAELTLAKEALANPNAPSVVWLSGSGCTGCSISFLNRVSTSAPLNTADVLINAINLTYHPQLMGAAGDLAVAQAERAYSLGNYILIVEGGVPTAFGGNTCWAWSYQGKDVTFMEAVRDMASRAKYVVTVGNCAGWGGMSAAPPNPTGVKGVSAAIGKPTISIAGCPPHPDWVVWAIVQLLLGRKVALDTDGRPTTIYGRTVHSQCPRRERDEAERYGLDGYCLKELGCRGPETGGPCPVGLWNNGVNWCVGANAPCIGCTDPSFPTSPLLGGEGGEHGDD